MQKLVTIYPDNQVCTKGKFFAGGGAEKHGFVEEHLQECWQQGWAVKAIHGFGGNSETYFASGWVIALLEKQDNSLLARRFIH